MLRSLLSDLLLPPSGLVIAGLLAALFWPRRGRLIAGGALALLLLLGLPATSKLLLVSLEGTEPAVPSEEPAGAIVILSGDVLHLAVGRTIDPGPLTLDRLRAGAALHRVTGLPLLVSGGFMPPATPSLAAMMARSLTEDFGVPVRWQEARSRDTWENAEMTAAILHEAGITRVHLVTHAWHMPRSLLAFQRAGLQPIAAPLRSTPWPSLNFGEFIPRPSAWQGSFFALHEWVGLAYYHWRS